MKDVRSTPFETAIIYVASCCSFVVIENVPPNCIAIMEMEGSEHIGYACVERQCVLPPLKIFCDALICHFVSGV